MFVASLHFFSLETMKKQKKDYESGGEMEKAILEIEEKENDKKETNERKTCFQN
jgi:hypothetical protein